MDLSLRVVILSAIIFCLAACASSGKKFSIDDADKVQNGMTREQVIKIMGTTPYSISDQGKTFVWSWASVGVLGGTKSRAVTFRFDEEGKTYGIPAGGVYGDIKKYQD